MANAPLCRLAFAHAAFGVGLRPAPGAAGVRHMRDADRSPRGQMDGPSGRLRRSLIHCGWPSR